MEDEHTGYVNVFMFVSMDVCLYGWIGAWVNQGESRGDYSVAGSRKITKLGHPCCAVVAGNIDVFLDAHWDT